MSNETKYYDLLIKYLDEPKDNDPFNQVRITLLGMTKDKASMQRIIAKVNASPRVNCNKDKWKDADASY